MSEQTAELMQGARFYAEKQASLGDVRPYRRYRNNLYDAFMAGAEYQRRKDNTKEECLHTP